ncbi:hypothetical protein MPH_00351 [Macrophomina phaseolina MS6]|uniref:Uncharacterized protein n=1 Tax=Macrophomina phaseolina (strain MS6) TaxID=1126212 RepID=K2SIH5_MACPH|nr:hypothetical protein MPH_00351 [Macrophomina phaseolina MS6]
MADIEVIDWRLLFRYWRPCLKIVWLGGKVHSVEVGPQPLSSLDPISPLRFNAGAE